jgi:hypothetical protein
MDYFQERHARDHGTFEGFDLSTCSRRFSPEAGIAFQPGKASGTFTGQLTMDKVDLTINVSLKDLQAKATGDGVLGLGAEKTSQVMDTLKELTTTIRVVGSPTDPQLVFDAKGLTEEFKQALVKAGKDRLAGELNKQLDKQSGQVLTELKDAEEAREGFMEGLAACSAVRRKKKDRARRSRAGCLSHPALHYPRNCTTKLLVPGGSYSGPFDFAPCLGLARSSLARRW